MEEKKEEPKKTKTNCKKEVKKDAKVEKLKEEIARLKKELEKKNEEFIMQVAEMQTTKRRIKDEMALERKYFSQALVKELIDPLDMFLQTINCEVQSDEVRNYQFGFKMIADNLCSVLQKNGLKEIKCNVGDMFDSKNMEAIEVCETINKDEAGKILCIRRKGYMYHDRLLRPVGCSVSILKESKKEEN